MLITLPDILSAGELALARRLLTEAPWDDGRESAGPQAQMVKNNGSTSTISRLPGVRRMSPIRRPRIYFFARSTAKSMPPP